MIHVYKTVLTTIREPLQFFPASGVYLSFTLPPMIYELTKSVQLGPPGSTCCTWASSLSSNSSILLTSSTNPLNHASLSARCSGCCHSQPVAAVAVLSVKNTTKTMQATKTARRANSYAEGVAKLPRTMTKAMKAMKTMKRVQARARRELDE